MRIKNSLLFFFIILAPLQAEDIYVASDILPEEFHLLIETLQDSSTKKDQDKSLDNTIKKFESSFRLLPEQEINFILKTQIIKFLLENPPAKFNPKDLNTDKHEKSWGKLKKEKNTLSPLYLWFLKSIYSDVLMLMKSSYFPSVALRIKRGQTPTAQNESKLYGQLKILLPFLSHYLATPVDEYQLYQNKSAQALTTHLENYFEYYGALSQRPPLKEASLRTFFTKIPKPKKMSEKTVMAILDNVKIDSSETKPTDKEEWKPKNTLSLFPTPNPNYSPPEKLPEPIPNWSHELGQLYPVPNPNYIPPATLPRPAKNWVEKIAPTPTPPGDPDENWIIE